MALLDLFDACRTSGLPVTSVDGWTSRGRPGPWAARPRGIMLHHTATPDSAPGDYPSLRVVRDGRPELPGPLSQLGLARSGTVLVIAAGRASHAGDGRWPGLNGNSDTLGIEAESAGTGRWTPAQLDAYPRLVAALAAWYGIPANRVIAHREWAPQRKIDPAGIDMDVVRQAVRSWTGSGGGITVSEADRIIAAVNAAISATRDHVQQVVDIAAAREGRRPARALDVWRDAVSGEIAVAAPGVWRRVTPEEWQLLGMAGYVAVTVQPAQHALLRELYLVLGAPPGSGVTDADVRRILDAFAARMSG